MNEYPELSIQAARDIVEQGPGTYVFAAPADNNIAGRQRTRVATALKGNTQLKYSSRTDREAGTLTITIEATGSARPAKAAAKTAKRSPRRVIAAGELPASAASASESTPSEPTLIDQPTGDYTVAVLVGATGVLEADPEVLVVHAVEDLYSDDIERVQRVFDAARKVPTATGKSLASAAYQRIGALLGY